jgi:hypothetical protein
MFARKLDLFSIRTIAILTHTKLVISKINYIPNLRIAE